MSEDNVLVTNKQNQTMVYKFYLMGKKWNWRLYCLSCAPWEHIERSLSLNQQLFLGKSTKFTAFWTSFQHRNAKLICLFRMPEDIEHETDRRWSKELSREKSFNIIRKRLEVIRKSQELYFHLQGNHWTGYEVAPSTQDCFRQWNASQFYHLYLETYEKCLDSNEHANKSLQTKIL